MIAIMNQSGLGDLFGTAIIHVIGESRNLYLITAVLCIGASVGTQFMNNMACAGMLAPVGFPLQRLWEPIHRPSFWQLPLEPDVSI